MQITIDSKTSFERLIHNLYFGNDDFDPDTFYEWASENAIEAFDLAISVADILGVSESKMQKYNKLDYRCYNCKHSFQNPHDQYYCKQLNENGKHYDIDNCEDCGGKYYELLW